MDNCTGISDNSSCPSEMNPAVLKEPGFAAFYLVLFLILVVALVLVVLSIASLCGNSGVPRVLSIYLINQLVGCIVVITFASFIFLAVIIITLNNTLNLIPYCHFLIWGFAFGAVGRMWSLFAFSIVVFIVVKRGEKVFKCGYIVVGIVGAWVVAFLVAFYTALPYPVFAVHFVDNIACFPNSAIIPRTSLYPAVFIWVVFGGIIPLSASITTPIITLCYIRRNTITEGAAYNRGIAKFALFLVVGNVVNFLGQAVTGLVALVTEAVGVILAYLLASLSLLPTPIIIIIFMKPVRDKLKRMLCRICHIKGYSIFSTSDSKVKSTGGGTSEPPPNTD